MSSIGRVLIVDDHALFRSGLAQLLVSKGVEVVGEAADGLEAIGLAKEKQPDIILMDIRMPRCGGLEATRSILEFMPTVRIVILTVSDDDDDLFNAIRSGAQGYLLKNVAPDELIRLLEGVAAGESPISGSMASRLLAEFAHRTRAPVATEAGPAHPLTQREMAVLRLVAAGNSNREVAAALAISENTVKNHLRSILEKLHLENRVQAVAFAIRQGLVQEEPAPAGQ